MQPRKPILALSDLTDKSSAALQFAGSLAQLLGAELQLLHALSLKHRALRAVVPALNNLGATIQSHDEALRAQLRNVLPHHAISPVPVIDLDQPARALQLRSAQVEPMVVVTPGVWGWPVDGFARLAAPMLTITSPREAAFGRVLVLSSPDAIGSETIESAGRWSFWLDQIYRTRAQRGGPEFDVVLIEEGMPAEPIVAKLSDGNVDLVAIDAAMWQDPDLRPTVDAIIPRVLNETAAPTVILPRVKQCVHCN